MDKFARKVPSIRSYKVLAPIVFAPNVQVTHYKSWRDEFGFYKPMMKAFIAQQNTSNVLFMPNVVSPVATIQERAKQLTENLEAARKRLKVDRVHLVTHSFAGVDARAAISMYGAHEHVQSLSTIASPHTGCRLVQEMRHHSYVD